jgi:hypothetical protein
MSQRNKLKFQRGAAAKTKFEDRKGAENRHHDRDGKAGPRKISSLSQPCGNLSRDRALLWQSALEGFFS